MSLLGWIIGLSLADKFLGGEEENHDDQTHGDSPWSYGTDHCGGLHICDDLDDDDCPMCGRERDF